jgi:hypothetical protein
MAMYAIHCPSLAGDREAAAEAMRATPIGFCYRGFVFGPFWLAVQRLWLPFLIYVAVAALIGFLVASGVFAAPAAVALELAAAVLIGLEGRNWLEAALERRGLPLVDIIEARDEDEAARIYFTRALAAAASSPSGPRLTGPRPVSGIIGLFPEAQR